MRIEDVYLHRLEEVLRAGVRDLFDAADRMGLPFDLVCHIFNSGLLKGYWKITLIGTKSDSDISIRETAGKAA